MERLAGQSTDENWIPKWIENAIFVHKVNQLLNLIGFLIELLIEFILILYIVDFSQKFFYLLEFWRQIYSNRRKYNWNCNERNCMNIQIPFFKHL